MCSAFLSAYNPSPVLDTAIPMLRVHQPSWTVMNESPTMECWSKFDGIKKLLPVHRSHSFTHKTLGRLDHPLNDGKHSSDNRGRNGGIAKPENRRVFTVGLLPANWLPELKDGGVGVSVTHTHNTDSLTASALLPYQPPPVSECQAVNRQDGWRWGGRCRWLGGARCYWSLVCQFLSSWVWQPCPRRPAPVSGSQHHHSRSPAVSGKHNSETAAHPTGDTVENSGIKLSLKMRGWQNDWGDRRFM